MNHLSTRPSRLRPGSRFRAVVPVKISCNESRSGHAADQACSLPRVCREMAVRTEVAIA